MASFKEQRERESDRTVVGSERSWRSQWKKERGRTAVESERSWRSQWKRARSAGYQPEEQEPQKQAGLEDLRANYQRITGKSTVGTPVHARDGAGALNDAVAGRRAQMEEQAAAEPKKRGTPLPVQSYGIVDLDALKKQEMESEKRPQFGQPIQSYTVPEQVPVADLLKQKAAAEEQAQENSITKTEDLSLFQKIAARPEAYGHAMHSSAENYSLNALKTLESVDALARPGINPTPIERMSEAHEDLAAQLSRQVEQDKANGKISGVEAQYYDTLTRMIPDTMLAAMTGGGSAVGGLEGIVKNPMFWTSFVQEYGGNYDELTQNGLSTKDAILAALPAAVVNAGIEVQGGTEKVLGDIFSGVGKRGAGAVIKNLLLSSGEEALEEALQAPVSNMMAAMTYDPDREVINAEEILQNAGYAFVSSLLLSGGTYGTRAGIDAAFNRADNVSLGKAIQQEDGGTKLLQTAMQSEDNSVRGRAESIWNMAKEGKKPGPNVLGRLANDLAMSETAYVRQNVSSQPNAAQQAGEETTQQNIVQPESVQENSGSAADLLRREGASSIGLEQEMGRNDTGVVPYGAVGKEVSQPNPQVGRAQEFASSLGEQGKPAYLAAVEDAQARGTAEASMRSAWQQYYNAGKWGKSIEWANQTDSAAGKLITGPHIAEQAFRAGQQDAEMELKQDVSGKTQAQKLAATREDGLIMGTGAANVDENTRTALDTLGRTFGYRFELTEMAEGQNGGYDPTTGTITLNSRSGGRTAIINVAKHEITHQMQQETPEMYRKFKDYVASALYEQDGTTFDALVQEQIDAYREQVGQEISREMAEDEVVANATEMFLTDEGAVERLVKQDRSLGQKVLDAIRNVIGKIKKALGGNEISQKASEMLAEDLDTLQKAEDMWVRMLTEKGENIQESVDSEARESYDEGKSKRYSLEGEDKDAQRVQDVRGRTEDTGGTGLADRASKQRQGEDFRGRVQSTLNVYWTRSLRSGTGNETTEKEARRADYRKGEGLKKNVPQTMREFQEAYGSYEYTYSYFDEIDAMYSYIPEETNSIRPEITRAQQQLKDYGVALIISKGPVYINDGSITHISEGAVTIRDGNNPKIFINSAFDNDPRITAFHELYHYIVRSDPDLQQSFQQVLLSHVEYNEAFEEFVERWAEVYSYAEEYQKDSDAVTRRCLEELGAFYCGEAQQMDPNSKTWSLLSQFIDDVGVVNLEMAKMYKTFKDRQQSRNQARYQLEIPDHFRDVTKLLKENEKLRSALDTLRQEFKLTKGAQVSRQDVEKLTARVLKEHSSDYGAGQLAEKLHTIFDYIANDPEPNFETVWEVTTEAARGVLEKSESLDRSLWEESAEARERIRQTPVYVSEKERGDFAAGGGYEAFRRGNFGKFKLVNDQGALSVDQLYGELARDYPGWFDGEAASAYDQLCEINDFLEAVKPRLENPYGENIEQQAAQLAGELFDSYFDLPQVKTFADKQKAKLDALRRQHRQEMAALRQEQKTKYETKLKEVREAAKGRESRLREEKWQKVRAEKLAAREARETLRDRRAVSESRKKIEKKAKGLAAALLKPSDSRSIPEGMRAAVQELLGSLDFTGKKGPDTKVSAAWAELQNQVRAAEKDTESVATIDPDLADRIGDIQGASLNEMTRKQAEDLYKVISALDKACREVRIELADGRTATATEAARGIIQETEGIKRKPGGFKLARGVKDFFDYDLADPTRFGEMFGPMMEGMVHSLRDGHDKMVTRWQEALDYTDRLMDGTKAWKWSEEKPAQFTLESGKTIDMTPAQVMNLYLLNQREQGRKHLYKGGMRTGDIDRHGKIIEGKRIQVTEADVTNILGSLTEEQVRVADGLGKFMSKNASGWGNEVSMELYGYRKFTEEHYWPISSDRSYTVSQMDGQAKDGTLAGLGMTKQTVQNASNPLVVGDVFDVFSKHISQMAAYDAFVPKLEQFKQVYNWKTSHDGNFRSVKESIERAGGEGATRYIQKFVEDINGRGRVERSPSEKWMGRFKAGAIAGNIRVVVQQPTAYVRAAAVMNPKYLLEGLVLKSGAEEMKTYAPIARWKDWGYFEAGNGKQFQDLMLGSHGALNKLNDASMYLPGAMDNLTWGRIWAACKAEIKATTDLTPGSEEFLQAAGKRFTEIIDKTQVVDSVFHRTQLMRSNNALAKMSTAFMGEPLKSLNLCMAAIREVQQANGFKGKAKAGGKLLRTVTAFCATAAVNALVVAFVDAARDDDDDESYWEKYQQALLGEYGEDLNGLDRTRAFLGADLVENLNPLTMIPYVKDLLSLFQGYDIQRMDMQGLSDLSEKLLKWPQFLSGNSKYTAQYLIKETAASLSKLFGLPVANIIRDVESMVNLSLTIADDNGADTLALRYAFAKKNLDMQHSANKQTFVKYLFEARQKGDLEMATRIYNDLIGAGYTNGQLETAMTNQAKKLLENQEMIRRYIEAEDSADAAGMADVTDELLAEGYTADEIIKAAKAQRNADSPDEEEAGEPIEESFWTDYGGEEQSFDVGFLTNAILSGNQDSIDAATRELLDSGKEQKDIDSSLTSELKKRMAKEMGYEHIGDMPDGVYFDTGAEEYKVLHDRYGLTQYGYEDAAEALAAGKDGEYNRIRKDMLGHSRSVGGEKIDDKKFTDGLKTALKTQIAERAGFDNLTEMKERGQYLDITSKEYKVLRNQFGWTQFTYSEVAKAYAGDVKYNWKLMVQDMAGKSNGSTSYPADLNDEKYAKGIRDNLLSMFKKGMYEGTASKEELRRWMGALASLPGKYRVTEGELEKKYQDYRKGREEKGE